MTKLEKTPQRILVKEVNWLGDVVISLPALRTVRQAFPAATLTLLVRQELASFFDGAEWVDAVIPYTVRRGVRGLADQRRIVAEIRLGRFDVAILFPRSFRSAFWTALARVPLRAGFTADSRGVLLTHKVARPSELFTDHQAHEYLYMLDRTLGVRGRLGNNVLDLHRPHQVAMRDWLTTRRRRATGKLIALAVGAAYGPAKEWPAPRYAAVIDALSAQYGAECVLIGAPTERRKCEDVARASRAGALVAAGQTSVGQAMALLSLCDGFAGNDSGPMHVAGALGIPTVGIYGSTHPHRARPLGPRTRVLYHRIACSPCMERTCRFGHYDCLKRIDPEEVVAGLADLGALG